MVAAVAAISLSAFAADEDSVITEKVGRKAFRDSVSQQLSEVQAARASLKEQCLQNKELAAAIKAVLKADKDSENPTISEDARVEIELLFGEINEARSTLKETKSEVKAAAVSKKESMQALDEDGVTSACQTLVSLLEGREQLREDIAQALNEINTLIS